MNALNDRVLVLPAKTRARTESGIVIAAAAKDEPEQGVVVAVGPAATSGVEPGQRVIYAKGQHERTHFNDQELIGLRDRDLLAVVEA